MSWHVFSTSLLVGIFCLGSTLSAQTRFAHSNSRSRYVHWIDLYDANNRRIDPTDPNAPPYSPVTTCGRCHDYQAMAAGHHFNASLSNVPAGRAGEPWVWTDDRTGTQIPLSYRGWEGTYQPEELGISDWDFVLKFGRHLPGGGPGERMGKPAPAGDAAAEEDSPAATDEGRWQLSGALNVDCMFCHQNDNVYSPEVWWQQIQHQNFAWAPTAAAGLASVTGRVSTLPDDFDPATATPEGRHQLPKTNYQNLRIDAENKVFIDVVRTPHDDSCYYCHTVQPVGEGVAPSWTYDQDVHLAAGMTCSDCHRNGVDHHTVRGYEGEQHPSGQSVVTLSCRGCHMGEADAGGRFAAPRPLHKGLPAFHLDIMSCTSCHSGPRPSEQAQQFHTAMAHGLGLPSHDYTAALAPGIVAPVLLQEDGVLYPHRMIWPAFWGRMDGERITPLNPEVVHDALRRVLRVRRGQTLLEAMSDARLSAEERADVLGEERAGVDDAELSEDEQARLAAAVEAKAVEGWRAKLAESLAALQELLDDEGARPVHVSGGKAHRLAEDGSAESFQHEAAEPYAWKLAHDVRPAMWSSGVRGCFECHAPGTPIFEGQVTAIGTVPEDDRVSGTMYQLAGYDMRMQNAWNTSFQGRPFFKYGGFAAMGIVGLVLLAYLLAGIRGVAGMFRTDM